MTETAVSTKLAPSAKTRTKKKHSTAHYRVDADRAEILARHFPSLSEVEIRECLEGAPLKQAVSLINWAERKNPANPYKPLRNWARKNNRGFYSPEVKRLDSAEHYRRCMLYIRRKDAEKQREAGRPLFQREREELVRAYYAPRYRAEQREAAQTSSRAA